MEVSEDGNTSFSNFFFLKKKWRPSARERERESWRECDKYWNIRKISSRTEQFCLWGSNIHLITVCSIQRDNYTMIIASNIPLTAVCSIQRDNYIMHIAQTHESIRIFPCKTDFSDVTKFFVLVQLIYATSHPISRVSHFLKWPILFFKV